MRNEGLTPQRSTVHTLTGDPYKHAVSAGAAGQTLSSAIGRYSLCSRPPCFTIARALPSQRSLPLNALSYRATYCILQCPASISYAGLANRASYVVQPSILQCSIVCCGPTLCQSRLAWGSPSHTPPCNALNKDRRKKPSVCPLLLNCLLSAAPCPAVLSLLLSCLSLTTTRSLALQSSFDVPYCLIFHNIRQPG